MGVILEAPLPATTQRNSGRLRRPHHVPDDVFLAEIEFFQLEKVKFSSVRQWRSYGEGKGGSCPRAQEGGAKQHHQSIF